MQIVLRYATAVGVVLIAWLITAVAWDLIRPAVALFFVAVMVAAWSGGFGPGLLASILAAVVSERFLFESAGGDIGLRGPVRFGVFLLSALLINWLNSERRRVEKSLRQAHADLERRVDERTAELRVAVDTLRREVAERERAEREIRAQEERLRELASELSLAEERQLRRIATELHDGIGQLLFSAEIRVDLLEDRVRSAGVLNVSDAVVPGLEEIRSLIAESIQRTRSLTVEVSPPALYQAGFVPAVRWLASQVAQRHGLVIGVEADGDPEPVGEHVRVFLFQAVRELLANMVKHSGAGRGRIVIGRDDGELKVAVEDDGAGFDPAVALGPHRVDEAPRGRAPKNSFGLFNVRERLKHLGGRLEIESTPGRGARFILVVPVTATEPASDVGQNGAGHAGA